MSRPNETEYDVFISYRRDGGAETAKHLRDVLTERGYRVFFDTDSLRSGDFNRKLFDVIDGCKDFLLILSPGALDRCENEGDWVRLELAHALELKKNVVPVMSGSFVFPETLPADIDAVRWQNGVSVNIEFFDAMIDKLVSFLESNRFGGGGAHLFHGRGQAWLHKLIRLGAEGFFSCRGFQHLKR